MDTSIPFSFSFLFLLKSPYFLRMHSIHVYTNVFDPVTVEAWTSLILILIKIFHHLSDSKGSWGTVIAVWP